MTTTRHAGPRLRRLREERGLNQAALARALDLSPSYVNQLEQNQRPITAAVRAKLIATFGVDAELFSDTQEARLIAGLREAVAHTDLPSLPSIAELETLAASMPSVARTMIAMHLRHRRTLEQLELMAARVGDEDGARSAAEPTAFEEVRDYFNARENHIPDLDEPAERAAVAWAVEPGRADAALETRLRQRHRVTVVTATDDSTILRHYDPAAHVLRLAPGLSPGRRAFQMAAQLALLEEGDTVARLSAAAHLSSDEARALARIGLANYYAGALLLPYTRFLAAAEAVRYDIDRLSRQFDVGFETVCHRLSTLQRPTAHGVPFFFIRVDRAGNISKRQSATHFHFSKVGGTCPLWNVYEAFSQPGRILTQVTRMPDGRAYLWIARTVSGRREAYGQPEKTFAIGLGCDLDHAHRLVYAKGLDLHDPDAATPIGMGCKVCERPACAQRAFPFIGRPLDVNEDRRSRAPYAAPP